MPTLSFINNFTHNATASSSLRLVVCPLVAGVAQTTEVSGSEEQQCERPEDDLEVMLHAAIGGYFCISPFKNNHLFTRCLVSQVQINSDLSSTDSSVDSCPAGWSWWSGRCFFFSVGLLEDRQWNQSAEFCRQQGSSLAVITDAAEMVESIERGKC